MSGLGTGKYSNGSARDDPKKAINPVVIQKICQLSVARRKGSLSRSTSLNSANPKSQRPGRSQEGQASGSQKIRYTITSRELVRARRDSLRERPLVDKSVALSIITAGGPRPMTENSSRAERKSSELMENLRERLDSLKMYRRWCQQLHDQSCSTASSQKVDIPNVAKVTCSYMTIGRASQPEPTAQDDLVELNNDLSGFLGVRPNAYISVELRGDKVRTEEVRTGQGAAFSTTSYPPSSFPRGIQQQQTSKESTLDQDLVETTTHDDGKAMPVAIDPSEAEIHEVYEQPRLAQLDLEACKQVEAEILEESAARVNVLNRRLANLLDQLETSDIESPNRQTFDPSSPESPPSPYEIVGDRHGAQQMASAMLASGLLDGTSTHSLPLPPLSDQTDNDSDSTQSKKMAFELLCNRIQQLEMEVDAVAREKDEKISTLWQDFTVDMKAH